MLFRFKIVSFARMLYLIRRLADHFRLDTAKWCCRSIGFWFALLLPLDGAQAALQSQDELLRACIPAWVKFGGQDKLDGGIEAIARGPDGFIYLGGSTGLVRLEGGDIREWFPDPTDPDSLSAGAIIELKSVNGRLLIGNGVGLSQYDPLTDTFGRVPITEDYPNDPRVRALYQQGDTLFIGTSGRGVFRIDAGSLEDPSIVKLEQDNEKPVVFDFQAYRGKIVIATTDGLEVFSENDSSRLIRFENSNDEPGGVESLALSPNGELWAAAAGGLYRITALEPLTYQRYTHETMPTLPAGKLEAVEFDLKGRLWVGARSGLARWDLSEPAPRDCRRSRFLNPDRDVSVSFLEGGLGDVMFMGTRGSQAKVAVIGSDVRRISNGEAKFSNLPNRSNWSTLIDQQGRLLLGTATGLYRERALNSDTFDPLFPNILGERTIYAIHQRSNGEIWTGTDRGLYVIDDNGPAHIPMVINWRGVSGAETINKIAAFKQDLLIASHDGLIVFDPQSRRVKRIFHSDERERTIDPAPATIVENGSFWHVSVSGNHVYATGSKQVYRLDVEGGSVEASTLELQVAGEYNAGRMTAAVESENGRVFVGTENGVIISDAEFRNVQYLTKLNGSRIGKTANVVKGPDGTIWFSSADLGLLALNADTDDWRVYTVEDGLHLPRVTQGALSVSRNGHVTTATGNGVSIVSPATASDNNSKQTRFVGVDADSGQTIVAGKQWSVGPAIRDVGIRFASPDIVEEGRYWIRYAFSKVGQDANYQTASLDQLLTFRRLEPGQYNFSGELFDASGVVTPPLTFQLNVKAYWWQRDIVHFFAIIAAICLVAFAFLWRLRAVERNYQIVADERKRIAQDLHDTFLQDIIASKMIGRSVSESQTSSEAKSQIERMLGLLESATSSVRSSVQSLSHLTDMPPISEAIRKCEPPSQQANEIEIAVNEDGRAWSLGRQRRFFIARIVQEAINNACKHSGAKTVNVSIRWTLMRLTILVRDDGRGFDPASEQSRAGFGLGAMQRMAKAGRIKISISAKPGHGTIVEAKVFRFWW